MDFEKCKQEPIAIVGMACRLPGDATNTSKLWDLLSEGRNTWSHLPESRFQEKAFFHPDSKKSGVFHTQGGHFLEEDISRFDAPFFNISPAEAKAMDPQLRLLLESAYEAFENSGMTLNQLRGTDTGAYVAMYNRDYEKILMRDPEDLPFYFQTGNGEAMYANRLSYFFDLYGPSFTLDTGCSGSLVAIHQACQSIRNGESSQAIVGAPNLILDPASMIGPSFLQFYASDGRSKSFDNCADGYGRGEGICSLVLKSLSAAIADGDPVRAVIKSSVTNQDGRTAGITVPSGEAQNSLIHAAYAAAGLDPADTGYVETHGSGTAVGDTTESRSIGTVIGKAREAQGRGPVIMGSIKANLGHLENASGLAGLIEAVLVLTNRKIPQAVGMQRPNENIQWKEWNVDVATQPRELDCSQVSVNSFGFGGANVHLVLDRSHETERSCDSSGVHSGPLVFVLSARSSESARLRAGQLLKYLEHVNSDGASSFLNSLAYTLSARRSLFSWKAAVVASSMAQLRESLHSINYSHHKEPPRIGFIFTGQGAQWATMGRDLWESSTVFRDSIVAAEKCLIDLGVDWKLADELWKPANETGLNSAVIAQPACTAIQLALVDLLASWNIYPTAVTGHSSGEIAAAYACKAISFRDAVLSAYARGCAAGQVAADKSVSGAMIAVGLGPHDLQPYMSASSEGDGLVAVACINSPEAVTVSGDKAAVDILEEKLQNDGIFCRRLPVDVAYHSYHMMRVTSEYHDALATMEKARSNPKISFFSSVADKLIDGAELGPQYWVQNLVSPVLFSSALEKLVSAAEPQVLLEIGPHAALKGPVKQILKAGAKEVPYTSTLLRNQAALQCLTELAAQLFSHGAEIDVDKVNSMSTSTQNRTCLEDLPTYPWDHSFAFWHESRLSRNYRNRTEPPHSLLGVLSTESSWFEPRWRNYISLASHPWLAGHRIQGDVVFPAAAFMAMAIEAGYKLAIQQLGERQREMDCSIELSDVSISNSLIIPSSGSVELMFILRPATELGGRDLARRHEFAVYSSSDTVNVVEHCRGFAKVGLNDIRPSMTLLQSQFDKATLPTVRLDRWYNDLRQFGNEYTDLFKGLATATAGRGYSSATITSFPPSGEYNASLHPATLDLCLQTMLLAIDSTDPIRSPIMPIFIERVSMSVRGRLNSQSSMRVSSKVKRLSERKLSAHIEGTRADENGDNAALALSFQGLEATSLSLPNKEIQEGSDQVKACQKLVMMLDPDYLTKSAVNKICNEPLPPVSVQAKLANLRDACRFYARAAVKEISDDDVNRMTDFRKQYMSWLRKQADLCPHDFSADLLKQLRTSDAEEQMVCRIGDSLTAILKNVQDPLTLMVEEDLLYRQYEDNHSMQRCVIQAAEFARLLGLKSPGLRILEIGAGTGGATLPVLEALSRSGQALFSHYRFTDISVGFFGNAEKKLERWHGLVQYQKLDIETDPAQQGFEPADYDLVIATNVLHATTKIDKTVKNVRQLLKPGGKLLLVEGTKPTVHISFVFGPLPGWWLGSTQRNKDIPLLNEQEWNHTLTGMGFSGVDSILHSYPNVEDQADSFIVSTAKPDESRSIEAAKVALVLTRSQLLQLDQSLGYQTAQHISSKLSTTSVEILSLGDNRLQNRVCILLADLDEPLLINLEQKLFEDLKYTLEKASEVVWVTQGATDQSHNPMSNLAPGLVRVLRNENPHVPVATIDLDPESQTLPQEMAAKVCTFMHGYSSSPRGGDKEWCERNGNWLVPRVVEDTVTTDFVRSHSTTSPPNVAQLEPFYQGDRPLCLNARHTAGLHGISFTDNPDLEAPLSGDEIEIEVKASGVNFRDIMVSLGQIADENVAEIAGVVTKVGRDSQLEFAEGNRVYTWHVPRFASHVRCPSFNVQRIPEGFSFEEAASIPIIYCTAYHSLVTVAQMRQGDTILIHSGAGGVGQAAIILAQYLGATVFTTVGSDMKKQLLIEQYALPESHIFSSRSTRFVSEIHAVTKGRGVDVVLNSLSGAYLQGSLDALASLGRFVEIGKSDILAHARLDMSTFSRATSFSAVDLVQLMREKPQYMAGAFARVNQMLAGHQIKPVYPLKTSPISELEQVFRSMQNGKHVGKLVVTHGRDDEVKVLPRVSPVVRLRPGATYLVVGGQGGLGRALVVWMAKCGARYIVSLSPSGAERPLTRGLVEELAEMKVEFHAISCDIGDRRQLQTALAEHTNNLPPIHGVVHAGVMYKNSSFDNMTLESFQQPLRPKVAGTYNLHECLEDQPLDFFIMLSSYVGLLGTPGQANYTAGCSFQDAFARWRTSLGKPTYSLDLGTVRGAGYLHENPEALVHYEKMGLGGLPLSAVQVLVGYAMSNPPAHYSDSQIAIGWAPSATWSQAQYAALDPMFSYHWPSSAHPAEEQSRKHSGVDMHDVQETQPLSQVLSRCQTSEERTSAIIEALTAQIVGILGVAAEDVNSGKSIGDHGGDSLVAIEFRNWFRNEIGCIFTMDQVTSQLSVQQLAVQAAG